MRRIERPEVLRHALDQAYNSVVITTADLDEPGPRILYVNQAFADMTGYAPGEVLGRTPRILQGPRTDRALLDRLRACLEAGERFDGSAVNYRKDGTPYLVEWNIAPVRDAAGEVECFVSVQRDITRHAEVERYSQTLLNGLGEGVYGIDPAGRFTFVNPAAVALLGYDGADELLGRNNHEMIHHTTEGGRHYPESRCPIYRVMATGRPLDAWQDWFWRRDGSRFPVEVYASPLEREMGTVFGGVVVFRDISRQKHLEEELRHAAFHDRLTGLHNRRFFDNLLARELKRAGRRGVALSLLMLDIDHFKALNDRYGHLVGDDILKHLARVLESRLRGSDVLARWGGEEFIALLPETDLGGAVALAEAVRARVAEADFPGAGRVTVSIGVATHRPREAAKDLVHRADAALYAAKEGGRNRVAGEGGA